jgi:translocation protein SEC72
VQARFKAKDYKNSVAMYTASLQVASERMPWEASAIFKDEMSTVLCNRSAAFGAMGEVRCVVAQPHAGFVCRR